jgi:hypothetical protein
MRGRNPDTFGQSLGTRGKWVLALVGVVLVAVAGGWGIWSSVHPGRYTASANGCINLNVPSSMGGSLIHACGGKAQALCRNAYTHTDKLARLTRQQCHLAGLDAASLGIPTPAASP